VGYFETSPLRLLTGNIQKVEQVQNNTLVKKLIAEQPCRRFRQFETEKLRAALEEALRSEEYPPPSMREVARRLNYDQSHLRKHFPDLCRAISARYLAYQQEQRLDRLRKMSVRLQQTAEVLQKQGFSLSERQIGKVIGKRGIFKEDETRAALKCFLLAPE
jgi:AraC-like DNA-binding protein